MKKQTVKALVATLMFLPACRVMYLLLEWTFDVVDPKVQDILGIVSGIIIIIAVMIIFSEEED